MRRRAASTASGQRRQRLVGRHGDRGRAEQAALSPAFFTRHTARRAGGTGLDAEPPRHQRLVRPRSRNLRRAWPFQAAAPVSHGAVRSEEHTSELQSLMGISYAVFCLKKKKKL